MTEGECLNPNLLIPLLASTKIQTAAQYTSSPDYLIDFLFNFASTILYCGDNALLILQNYPSPASPPNTYTAQMRCLKQPQRECKVIQKVVVTLQKRRNSNQTCAKLKLSKEPQTVKTKPKTKPKPNQK